MSPEQASEQDLDGRAHIRPGLRLYEMLTGEQPFTGASAQVILAKRLSEPVPHLRTLRDVPPAVERAVSTALAKAPADRFVSAAAFAAALGLDAAQGSAAPNRQRNHRWVGVAGIGLVMALALIMLRSRGPPSAMGAQPIAVAVLPFHAGRDRGSPDFSASVSLTRSSLVWPTLVGCGCGPPPRSCVTKGKS
jgi:hypothetical protein